MNKWVYLLALFLFSPLVSAGLSEEQKHAIAQYQTFFDGKITGFGATLVPGMYAFQVNNDKNISVMAKDGSTILWNPKLVSSLEFDAKGNPVNQITFDREKMSALRNEIFFKIKKEDLITVKFGEGKEKMYLYSAVDCPACYKQEKALAERAADFNATVYILPYSLDSNNWNIVKKVMCSENRAQAWKKYWETRVIPENNGQCQWSKSYMRQSVSFLAQTMGIGAGTPTAILANGKIINPSFSNPVPQLGEQYPINNGIFGEDTIKTSYFD
ncbi:thioredoxin fold domain-containing protein [Vibrio amylolyticus]|uniref:thioredoxin fold domain-containing protein n=1 Tax=Vibrio amylolyticus TaxID=2847292 RepID=UPI00354CF88A